MDGQEPSARYLYVNQDVILPRGTVNNQVNASVNLDIREKAVNNASDFLDVDTEPVKRVMNVTVMKVIMEYSVTSLFVLKGVVRIMVSVGNQIHAPVKKVGQAPTVHSVYPARVASLEPVKIRMSVLVILYIKAFCVMSLCVQKDVLLRMECVIVLENAHAKWDGKEEIVQNV